MAWFPEQHLPALAFDHRRIIDHALARLRSRVEYPDIATRLIGDTFTLAQLHDVYEAVTGQAIDLANFRRKILASGELEDTGEKSRHGPQRPATLYRYVHREEPLGSVQPTWSMPLSGPATDPPDDPDEALEALMTTGRDMQ